MHPALSEHMDDTPDAGKDIFQTSMAPFCSVYYGHLKYIELEQSMSIGEEGDGLVQLVACNRPYHVRYEKGKGKEDHDGLREYDMGAFMVCMTSFIKKGANTNVFGSTLQLGL